MEQYIVNEFEKLSEDAKQLQPYIEIDLTDLQDAMVRHASGYVYLAQFAAMAKGQFSATKSKTEAVRGELFYAYKTGGAEGTRAPSDETVKAMVACSPRMQEARAELALAEMDDTYWTAIMNAMNQRGFFLRELFMQDRRTSAAERQYPAVMQETMNDLQEMAGERSYYASQGGEVPPLTDEVNEKLNAAAMDGLAKVFKKR